MEAVRADELAEAADLDLAVVLLAGREAFVERLARAEELALAVLEVLLAAAGLLDASGLAVLDLLDFRRALRWIFRSASISSSFRIACHPVTSCWRAKSAKSRRVWVFNSAVVIKRLLPVALKVGLNGSSTTALFSSDVKRTPFVLWGLFLPVTL